MSLLAPPIEYDGKHDGLVQLNLYGKPVHSSRPGLDSDVVENSKLVKLKRERATPASHPECVKCSTVKKRKPGEASQWALFLKKYTQDHPGLSANQAIVEARKRYIPPSGKPKSYERVWREIWRSRNPLWKTTWSPSEAKAKMREDFLDKI